jgi:hypothetical protein
MGPLEAIAVEGDAALFVIAGQGFVVSAAETDSFDVGDYVVAGATLSGDTAMVYHVGFPYVAGVSPVSVKGRVASIDAAAGTLTVGKLTIDYTAQLSTDPTLTAGLGNTVQAAGTQPVAFGTLVVDPSGNGIAVSSSPEDSAVDAPSHLTASNRR